MSVHRNIVLKALQGVAKAGSGPQRFGDSMTEKLGGTDIRPVPAFNVFAGPKATALVRVYQPDPLQAVRRASARAPSYLERVPRAQLDVGYPTIVSVRGFFASEGEDRYFLITEDVSGRALRVHIASLPSL